MSSKLLLVFTGLLVFSACTLVQPTGNTAADPLAAQTFLPNIVGYLRTDADSIVDAITAVTGGGSLLSGNVLLAGLVNRIDSMIQCYQNVGAVTAQIYTEQRFDITNPEIPAVGVVAILNQERLKDNFLACALGGGSEAFSAQAAVEPCAGSGDFTMGGQHFNYLYAATAPRLCAVFEQHFTSVRNQGG